MILLPSVFHGILGVITVVVIALALMISPTVFANNVQVWDVRILEGSSEENSSQIFYPNELPVSNGDIVQWINDDDIAHSITSGLPKHPDYYGYFFNPGLVEPGKKISIEIKISEGVEAFYYLCEIHPWMTGKIFTEGTLTSMPETENPISLNKKSYEAGDKIILSGQVHQDFWETDYQIQIYNEKNELVDLIIGDFDQESRYEQEITDINKLNMNGNYQIKLVYGLPSKAAQVEFDFINVAYTNSKTIPIWIKNVGEYWCNGQINDSEFVNAIQYLIKNDIINVQGINISGTSEQEIPEWVTNNTCWWSSNQIPDIDFLSGIEFLINKGTIRV